MQGRQKKILRAGLKNVGRARVAGAKTNKVNKNLSGLTPAQKTLGGAGGRRKKRASGKKDYLARSRTRPTETNILKKRAPRGVWSTGTLTAAQKKVTGRGGGENETVRKRNCISLGFEKTLSIVKTPLRGREWCKVKASCRIELNSPLKQDGVVDRRKRVGR